MLECFYYFFKMLGDSLNLNEMVWYFSLVVVGRTVVGFGFAGIYEYRIRRVFFLFFGRYGVELFITVVNWYFIFKVMKDKKS